MKTRMTLAGLALTVTLPLLTLQNANAQGGYVTGDFHQHSTYTDGSYTIGKMMEMNNRFGLDWWANSEHGGSGDRWGLVSGSDLGTSVVWSNTGVTLQGKANSGKMWRWQSIRDWSYRDVQLWRRVFPDKVILQGYEMNVPGHEHASMCIIANQFDAANDNASPVAQFEYMFDNGDTDDSAPLGWVKSTKTGHDKAVEAVTWLQTNYPTTSWLIPGHPERYAYNGTTGWAINHFRDLNNAGPDVFFGFESQPGHQRSAKRGEYGTSRPSYGTCTYGGTGYMSAKVGGLWDAMLSEGRHFWLFSNSDCHNTGAGAGDFFPGEYQKNYTYVAQKNDPQAIADGLRSGNNFVVTGDLIDALDFTIGDVSMGSTYNQTSNTVTVNIRLRDPQGANNNTYSTYNAPELDHVDIIAGICTGMVAPESADYTKDEVATTKVVARFGKTAAGPDAGNISTQTWTEQTDGWKQMSFTYPIENGQKLYFRLRGTNKTVNEAGETDEYGNPLMDPDNANSVEIAFSDLWFYSNPIFVQNSIPTLLSPAASDGFEAKMDEKGRNVTISFSTPQTLDVTITNIGGVVVKNERMDNLASKTISLADLTGGIYLVNADNRSDKIIIK